MAHLPPRAVRNPTFGSLALAVALLGILLVAPAASGSVAGSLRYAIDTSPKFSNPTLTAQRHRYVILQAWQTDRMRQLKAANPDLRVLVYKNLSASIADANNGYRSTGISHQEAHGEHPEWFLQNTSGQRFTFNSYSYLWAMDVGSPSYQRRWADNVIAEVQAEGWDGVFLDDVNTTMKYHYPVSQIAKYPNDGAWQEATRAALAHIGPRIRQTGKLAIPNIGSWGENAAVGRAWLQYVDGAMDEMFVKWGTSAGSGYAWDGHWERQLASLEHAQQQGKDYLAVTQSANGDAAAARYGWASLLLGASGRAAFALHGDYTNENWFDFYQDDLGQPAGGATKLASGAHRRTFDRGVVAVNPTESTATVQLGGTYSGSGHTNVTSIQLAPKTAVILSGSASTDPGGGSGSEPGKPGRQKPEGGQGKDKAGKGKASIKTLARRIRKGRVIARGRVTGARARLSAENRRGARVRVLLRRSGRVARRTRAQVRRGNRFVVRMRICRPGRYRVVAAYPATGERKRWPGMLRVRPRHLRCR